MGHKLVYKLTALAIMPVLISMILLEGLSYTVYKEQLIKERIEEAGALINLSSEMVKNPLYFLDVDKLNGILQNVKNNPNILSAHVTDTNGKIIADGTKENSNYGGVLGDEFTKKSIKSSSLLIEITDDALKISEPIKITENLGILQMEFSLGELNYALNRMLNIFVFVGGLLFLIIAAVDIFATRAILRQITLLTSAAEEISKGNLDAKADVSSKDDLGELAASFNQMAIDLKKSQGEAFVRAKEAEAAKKELEEKVAELERFNKLAVGRELKMIELKKRIAELEGKTKGNSKKEERG